MRNIPLLLKSKRLEHGVNLTDMGKRMNKSKQHIRYIEDAGANLTLKTVVDYLNALNLGCDVIIHN